MIGIATSAGNCALPVEDSVARLVESLLRILALLALCAVAVHAQRPDAVHPLHVKVVVVTMFERGEDTGDAPGELQFWVEREHLDQVIPMPAGYHHLRINKDGVLGILTGVGNTRAAASIMALGLDPRFDLSKAYWVVAGIGGGDPADVSLGSAIWADHVIDGDLAFELDARDIPADWPTGYVPLRKATPYEQPMHSDGELYTLNGDLVRWALQLTRNVPLVDNEKMSAFRSRFVNLPNAMKPPFVTRGDTMSASTFWHGSRMNDWANTWTRYFTGGKGNFMVSAMEDSGTMQALTFLNQAGRVDISRVLVLRTVSNYVVEPPGVTAPDSLKSLAGGGYPAFLPSLEAAFSVGDKVVRDLVDHWSEREGTIPRATAATPTAHP
jgi:purine nucleoside permease